VKILKAVHEKGIRFCIAIVFDRFVPEWLLRVRRFNVYEMETKIKAVAQTENVFVGWSNSEEETLAVERFLGPMRSVVDVGADDMRACYAKVDEELAAAFWMASNIFMESGLSIRYELEEDQVWLFGAYVEKRFRRQGIHKRILEFILLDLQSSGKNQVLLSVNPDNAASRIAHERYARRKVGMAVAIRFLGMAACTVSGDMALNRWFTLSHKKKPIVIRFARRKQMLQADESLLVEAQRVCELVGNPTR